MITTIKGAYRAGMARGEEESAEWQGDWDLVPGPLSGEWAGESIPEIFGSWDNATDARMAAYEEGYMKAFVRRELALYRENQGIS